MSEPRHLYPDVGVVVPDVLMSMEYLDSMFEHSGDLLYARDRAGRFLLANRAFAEMLGRPSCDIVGHLLDDVFPPAAAPESRRADTEVITSRSPRTERRRMAHPDGSTREYIVQRFPLVNSAGEVYGVGMVGRDVTDFALADREIRAAHEEIGTLFRGVFDHAPIGQIFSGIDSGITSVNAAMAAMLGYVPHEMIGRPVSEFAEPDEYLRIREDAAQLMDRRSLSVSAIRRFRHRDGHNVPVRVTSALLRTEDDQPRWWVSIVADISDEERARAELDQAHAETLQAAQRLQLLNSIATAANDSTDVQGVAPLALRAVCAHFGWPGGALLRWRALDNRSSDAADERLTVTTWTEAGTPTVASRARMQERLAHVGRQLTDAELALQPVSVIRLPVDESSQADEVRSAVVVPLTAASRPQYVWVFFATSTSLPGAECELLSLIGIETSRVVERQAAQQQMLDSEERFRSVFARSPLPMALTVGESGEFSAVNDALCTLLGRDASELIGHSAKQFTHPADVHLTDPAGAAAASSPDGTYCFELRLLHSSGAVVIAAVTLAWTTGSDGSRNLLAQMEDVTLRRQAEETLRRQAEQDDLTGLANRAQLSALLRRHADSGHQCGAVFIDLDGFKVINDTLGHDVGDQVLVEVARRLQANVRPTDDVARFGGDEFVVLCTSDIDLAGAQSIAARIERAISEPILTLSGPVEITASAGVACGMISRQNPSALLQQADVAMYQAKRRGKDRVEIYDAQLHRAATDRQRTESALHNALAENRFIVYYQPIVELATSRIVSLEALVRLQDEFGELMGPDRFIAVAEQTGLIVPLGSWVLQEACRTIADLRQRFDPALTVSVNVAARQAARADLVDTVSRALADAGLDEQALSLELTESALLEADGSTLVQLKELRNRGIRISLDDFGTGYSSLTYLRKFPVSHLKVDRSFVAGITSNADDAVIVRAISQLARDLELGCVAEGIETAEQRDLLLQLGIPLGQGYLFSRPVPADQLPALLA